MPIRIVVSLALVRAKAPLRALADIALEGLEGEITIRRCAVFERDGQPPWVSLPRLQIEKNGKKQFVPLIEPFGELKRRVLDSVMNEYRSKHDSA